MGAITPSLLRLLNTVIADEDQSITRDSSRGSVHRKAR
jgi:hypothetical protein